MAVHIPPGCEYQKQFDWFLIHSPSSTVFLLCYIVPISLPVYSPICSSRFQTAHHDCGFDTIWTPGWNFHSTPSAYFQSSCFCATKFTILSVMIFGNTGLLLEFPHIVYPHVFPIFSSSMIPVACDIFWMCSGYCFYMYMYIARATLYPVLPGCC